LTYLNYFADTPVGPLISRFSAYPTLVERLDILIRNTYSVVLFLVFFLFLYKALKNKRQLIAPILFGSSILITQISRILYGYSYDTDVALISILADLGIIIFLATDIGFSVFKKKDLSDSLLSGFCFMAFISFFLTYINLNRFINPEYFVYSSAAVSIYIMARLFQLSKSHKEIPNLKPTIKPFILSFLSLIIFLPYIFTPAPPDADITSQIEILGYLYQGMSLDHVTTGYMNEIHSIRYPSGFPSLGYTASMLLNIRGSESALILWYAGYLLALLSILKLGKQLGLPLVLVLFCFLNPTILGPTSLQGGQVPDFIAFAFCVYGLVKMIAGSYPFALMLFAGSAMIQPTICLPFLLCSSLWIPNILSNLRTDKKLIGSLVVCIITCIYLVSLLSGVETANPVANHRIGVDLEIFEQNIMYYLFKDTMLLPYVLLALLIPIFTKKSKAYTAIALWAIGGIIVDGLFGDSQHLHGGRMTAVFTVIGSWVIALALTIKYITNNTAIMIPKFKPIMLVLLSIGWIGMWYVGYRSITFFPSSVFTSHSNIKMGRYITSITDKDILVVNIRPPQDKAINEGFGFNMRSDSLKNTINARINPHHLKKHSIASRSEIYKCKDNNLELYIECLQKLDLDYLVIDARPQTEKWVLSSNIKPTKQIGQTYLFKL